nr:hypothetical protein [uncultured Mediterraneibacter sp.]
MEPEVRNKLDLAIEIRDVYAREILDFAGNPAIEVEVLAGGEIIGKASVAGENYSKKEQIEKQTEKQQVHIEEKIELLNSQIAPEIIGENVFEQRKIDTILKENGNEQTSFAISLAVARAAAAAEKIPLYRYLGGVRAVHPSMPQLIRKEEIEIEKIKEIKVEESTVLTKLFERILEEQNEGKKMILSQETAGTEDSFLVDLAVAANITMILVENRESAYYTVLNNRLLQLEEKIGG